MLLTGTHNKRVSRNSSGVTPLVIAAFGIKQNFSFIKSTQPVAQDLGKFYHVCN